MRGTTPRITYELPFAASTVAKAKLIIAHGGSTLLRKDTSQIQKQGSTLSVTLTREDTVKLPEDTRVQIQLEVETTGGDCLVTAPESIYTGSLLDEGALV